MHTHTSLYPSMTSLEQWQTGRHQGTIEGIHLCGWHAHKHARMYALTWTATNWLTSRHCRGNTLDRWHLRMHAHTSHTLAHTYTHMRTASPEQPQTLRHQGTLQGIHQFGRVQSHPAVCGSGRLAQFAPTFLHSKALCREPSISHFDGWIFIWTGVYLPGRVIPSQPNI